MKIFVEAKPNAKENRVEKIDAAHYRVRLKAPARQGQANEILLEVLGDYFNLPKSRIRISSGRHGV